MKRNTVSILLLVYFGVVNIFFKNLHSMREKKIKHYFERCNCCFFSSSNSYRIWSIFCCIWRICARNWTFSARNWTFFLNNLNISSYNAVAGFLPATGVQKNLLSLNKVTILAYETLVLSIFYKSAIFVNEKVIEVSSQDKDKKNLMIKSI